MKKVLYEGAKKELGEEHEKILKRHDMAPEKHVEAVRVRGEMSKTIPAEEEEIRIC